MADGADHAAEGRGSTAPGAELLVEGRRRYEAGDIADAEPLARRALELRPPGGPPDARSEALQLVAETEYSQGHYAEAARTAAEARSLRDGAAPDVVAETDNLLGIIALARGDVATALPLIRGGFEARAATLGPDASDTIESLNNLAAATARDGRIEEAVALSREALIRGERGFEGPHRQLAVALNGLAVKLDRAPETRDEAARLYARALDVAEAALGPEHPLVATLHANVATQRLNSDDLEGARPSVVRSVDLHERRYGPDHPNTATAILNAAELARREDDLATARPILERALAVRLGAFGPADIRTRQVLVRLVSTLGGLKSTDPSAIGDGILLLEVHRALAPAADGTPPPPLEPAILGRLTAYLERRRSATEALGDTTARRAVDRARLAALSADRAFMAGDRDAARVALDDAIDAIGRVLGPDSLDLVELLHRRAAVARADDRRDEAIADEERALAILGTAYGEAHPYVLRARLGVVRDLQLEYGLAAGRPLLQAVRAQLEVLVRRQTAADPTKDPSSPVAARTTQETLLELVERHVARIPSDAIPAPVGRSARRRAALAAVGPLAAELLPGLEQIGWTGLASAHGPAVDVPVNLRLLLADEADIVAGAVDRLADVLLHQGSLYPASAAAVEPLRTIAGDGRVRHRTGAIDLLAAIVAGAALRSQVGGPALPGVAADTETVRVIARQTPAVAALLERLGRDADGDVRTVATAGRALLARAGASAASRRAN